MEVFDDKQWIICLLLFLACGIQAMGPNQAFWRRSQVQLYVTQGWVFVNLLMNFHKISQLNLESSATNRARISKFNIFDDKCGRTHCSVCEVPTPVITVRVRGLCQLSLFDRFLIFALVKSWHAKIALNLLVVATTRMYSYIINEEGLPMFVGTHTSILFYNQSMASWVWWDQTQAYSNGILAKVRPEGFKQCGF